MSLRSRFLSALSIGWLVGCAPMAIRPVPSTTPERATLSAAPNPAATATAPPAVRERSYRVALVIGNAAYDHSPLRSPSLDAQRFASYLRDAGFDVLEGHDVDYAQYKELLRAFGRKARRAGAALFFFAGHGFEVGGTNYLLPVRSPIHSMEEAEIEGIPLSAVMAKMRAAGTPQNLIFVDACRDNPLPGGAVTRGLGVENAPANTLIAFSTAPGATAADGAGDGGVFTSALLRGLEQQDSTRDLEALLRDVRRDVMRETDSRQTPWSSSSLVEPFWLGARP